MKDIFQELHSLCFDKRDQATAKEVLSKINTDADLTDNEAALIMQAARMTGQQDKAVKYATYILDKRKGKNWLLDAEAAYCFIMLKEFHTAKRILFDLRCLIPADRREVLEKMISTVEFLEFSMPKNYVDTQSLIVTHESIFKTSLLNRLTEGRPFSICRVGDGEGTFWGSVDGPFRRNITDYCDFIADECFKTWFGRPISTEPCIAIRRLSQQLYNSYKESGIIGVNLRSLEQFYDAYANNPYRNHFTGYFGHYSGLALLEEISSVKDYEYIDAWAFHKFLTTDYIAQMATASGRKLTFISCHQMDRLIPVAETILIPGAKGENIPEDLKEGTHYPDRFNEIIDMLTESYCRDRLFLIGAGVLAKIYCAHIKRSSGVAIDVGSQLDYICGFKTR